MKLSINRNVLYVLVGVVGVALGISLYLLFQNFDQIKDSLGGLFKSKPVVEQPNDEDIPYFADTDSDIVFGEDNDWLFRTFQPKIVEYFAKDGANYMTVEYVPRVDEADPVQVDVLLTKDLDWIITEEIFKNIKEDDLSEITPSRMRYSPPQVGEPVEDETDVYIDIKEIKEKFKVGDRISLKLPYFYPSSDLRTQEYCERADMEKYLCRYAVIVDKLAVDLKELLMGEPVDEGTVVYPYSISDGLSLNPY